MPKRLLNEIVRCQNAAALLRTLAADADDAHATQCLALAETYDRMSQTLEQLARQLSNGHDSAAVA